MLKAVIFDVDGTLVDSVDQHAHAWQDVFRRFGYDFPYADIRNEIGKGSDQFLKTFLSEEEIKQHGQEITKQRVEIFREKYQPQVKAFPRVRELFERIRKQGHKIALATSAHGEELMAYLKMTGVEDLIEAQTSKDDAKRSKPEPDIFCAALDRIGIPAAEAATVGDSRYDAQAAKKAGAIPIGVLCGGFSEDDLRKNGCVEIYRDPGDLLDRFEDSALARHPQTDRSS